MNSLYIYYQITKIYILYYNILFYKNSINSISNNAYYVPLVNIAHWQ